MREGRGVTTGMDDWGVRRWTECSAMLKPKRPRKLQNQRSEKGRLRGKTSMQRRRPASRCRKSRRLSGCPHKLAFLRRNSPNSAHKLSLSPAFFVADQLVDTCHQANHRLGDGHFMRLIRSPFELVCRSQSPLVVTQRGCHPGVRFPRRRTSGKRRE